MSKNIGKVVILGSSQVERIGNTDKMKVIINAAVLDIEDNFLPMELVSIYINDQLVETLSSDKRWDISMQLQYSNNSSDTEIMVEVEHKASKQRSPKKLFSVLEIKSKNKEIQKKQELSMQIEKQSPSQVHNPISKSAAIVAVRENGLTLWNIEYAHLVDDRAVVIEAVKQNGLALEFASARLKQDIEIFNVAIEQNEDAALFADERLYNQYREAYKNAEWQGIIDSKFGDTKPLVLKAVTISTTYFRYISDRLKNDENIMTLILQKNWLLLEHVSARLKKNKKIVLLAIQNNSRAIFYADMNIQSDENIVLKVVGNDASLLEYMSESIRNNKSIVIVALGKNWLLLQYASDELKNDKDIVLIAVKQNWLALQYVSQRLKDDKDVVITAIKQNWHAIYYASNKFRNDKFIIQEYGPVTKSIVMTEVKKDGLALWRDDFAHRIDEYDIVVQAVKQNGLALQYVSGELKSNKEIVLTAINNIVNSCEYMINEFRDDKEIVLNVIQKDWIYLRLASPRLKDDKEIVLAAVTQKGSSLGFASNRLRDDKDVVLASFTNKSNAFLFVSLRLKWDPDVIRAAWR